MHGYFALSLLGFCLDLRLARLLAGILVSGAQMTLSNANSGEPWTMLRSILRGEFDTKI